MQYLLQEREIDGSKTDLKNALYESLLARLEVHYSLKGHVGAVNSIAWDPSDGLLLSAGDDGKVKLWDVGLKGSKASFSSGHQGGILNASFTMSSNQVVTAGSDGSVRHFDVHYGESGRPGRVGFRIFSCSRQPVRQVVPRQDSPSVLVSAGDDCTLRVHDLRERQPCAAPSVGHPSPHPASAVSSMPHEVSPRCVRVDLRHCRLYGRSRVVRVGINAIALHPMLCDQVAVAGDDTLIRVYDLRFCPQGATEESPPLFCCDYGALPSQPRATSALSTPTSLQATGVAFSSDGQRIAASFASSNIFIFSAVEKNDIRCGSTVSESLVPSAPTTSNTDHNYSDSNQHPPRVNDVVNCEWKYAHLHARQASPTAGVTDNLQSPENRHSCNATSSEGAGVSTSTQGIIRDDSGGVPARVSPSGAEHGENTWGSHREVIQACNHAGQSRSRELWRDEPNPQQQLRRITVDEVVSVPVYDCSGLKLRGRRRQYLRTCHGQKVGPIAHEHDESESHVRWMHELALTPSKQQFYEEMRVRVGYLGSPLRGHVARVPTTPVGFMGPRSEFVVSGSDCGHTFVWNTKQAKAIWCGRGPGVAACSVLSVAPQRSGVGLATCGAGGSISVWLPTRSAPVADAEIERVLTKNLHTPQKLQ